MLNTNLKIFFCLVMGMLITSCAATGDQFTILEAAPADKALVYIMRPPAFTASARRINIAVDEKEYIKIRNKGYTTALLDPGMHAFEQSSNYILGDPQILREKRKFDMMLEAGKTYFVGFHADSAVGVPWVVGKKTTTTSTTKTITTTIAIPFTFKYGFGVIDKDRALEELKVCYYQKPGE